MAENTICLGDATFTAPTLEELLDVTHIATTVFTDILGTVDVNLAEPKDVERTSSNTWWLLKAHFEGSPYLDFEHDFLATISNRQTMQPLVDKEFSIAFEFAEDNELSDKVITGTATVVNSKNPDGTFDQDWDFDIDWSGRRTVENLVQTGFHRSDDFILVDDLLNPNFLGNHFASFENENITELALLSHPVTKQILNTIRENTAIDNNQPYVYLTNALNTVPIFKSEGFYDLPQAKIVTAFLETLFGIRKSSDWTELKTAVPNWTELENYYEQIT